MTEVPVPPETDNAGSADPEAPLARPTDAPEGGYEVIARRYRPRTFREVVGQEAIAETLLQANRQDRLGHAYLFCGPRGVGKTSMARIFARSLQCPNAKDGEPCDKCGVCSRIFRGEDIDVVEMDGASHRGIDDVRELIQHVRYAPTEGPYRIFIIDEVHMLTREAFNSLLKTLEEPPPHVKFVFATTEPEKVLPTVLSRCQRFDFSPISPADIVRRLAQICEAEGATPEDGLLDRIASLARGGMRDSQSLLDQLLSFAGTSPGNDDLDRITGRLAPEAVETLIGCIERGERAEVVRRLEEVEGGGTDPAVLLEQVIEALRARLHAGVADGWGEPEIDRNLLAQEILQEARARVRRLGRADIILELALLRLSTLADLVPLSRWQEALAGDSTSVRPAAAVAETVTKARPAPEPESVPAPPPAEVRAPTPAPTPAPTLAPARAAPEPEPSSVEEPSATREAVAREAVTREAVTPEDVTPEDVTRGEESSDEALRGRMGVEALRQAVERPGQRSARRAAPRPEKETQEKPRLDPTADPRAVALAVLHQMSGSASRVVGDALRLTRDGNGFTLELSESGLGVLGEKRDPLRRELTATLGSPVRIELGEFESSTPDAGAPVAEDDTDVPDIVEKAREIFRGELFRGGPPPGR